MSNLVVTANSTIYVTLGTKNLSRRAVGMAGRIVGNLAAPSLVPECKVSLNSGSGERYILTPERPAAYFGVPPVSAGGGETNLWKFPLDIKGVIAPGDYTLSATQRCFFMDSTNHAPFEIVSNVLKVQIK
jgi:hypothetical protein